MSGLSPKTQTPEMQACIDACLRCHATCLSMAMNHCLPMGGKHTEPEHFKLMMACAEICRSSAAFMLIGTRHHRHTCRECAEICEECAASCEALGGMEDCVAACRECARHCAAMAA
ncbi:four-helix bundle copper-binding protein [Acetobacteraceae bacterium H6797]|nr:four-helix bundle copper-binding protein [Acetobacteraceae bacterium H6797]